MIDLAEIQARLWAWQQRNFGQPTEQQMALGMAEEIGEVCHAVLKHSQAIRGMNDVAARVAIEDGVVDTMVYGIQLLSLLGIDAETAIKHITTQVLARDWKTNPENGLAVAPGKEVGA